jgi:hypothetical protein
MVGFFDEMQKIAKKGVKMQPLSPAERAEANKRYAQAKPRMGQGDGCSPGKSEKGYDFHTHRSHTGWYPSFKAIPIDKIRFVGSTA